MKSYLTVLYYSNPAAGYAFIANLPDKKNAHLLGRQQSGNIQPGGPYNCPFNPQHIPAVPISTKYPYGGAKDGVPGTGVGGYQVPAPGDTDHQFIAPTDTDIRGPCPGLNAAANHGFIARDGITTYTELVDAVQNVYNMGFDLANFLATFSIFLADGDWSTKKMSIGCDATTRTSFNPTLTGSEPGLDGHNKFEADSSLTRNDYFLANGDDFTFNTTLWEMMVATTGGTFDLPGLAKFRYQRYQQSRQDNPEIFFGPLGVFTHGAASFVYELFPSGADNYQPTLANTASFFGVHQNPDGSWSSIPEQIPSNWTNRKTPYSILDVSTQIAEMYGMFPVGFGGNANGSFVGIDYPPRHQGEQPHGYLPGRVRVSAVPVRCWAGSVDTQWICDAERGCVAGGVGGDWGAGVYEFGLSDSVDVEWIDLYQPKGGGFADRLAFCQRAPAISLGELESKS